MRNIIAAATTAFMIATPALAGETTMPLAPGKPAGVRQARLFDEHTLLWIGAGVLIVGSIALASGGSSAADSAAASSAAASTAASTSTTTTSTTTTTASATTTS